MFLHEDILTAFLDGESCDFVQVEKRACGGIKDNWFLLGGRAVAVLGLVPIS
jgi:hypothetical protein